MRQRPLHSLSAAFAVGAFVAAMAVVVAIIAGAGASENSIHSNHERTLP